MVNFGSPAAARISAGERKRYPTLFDVGFNGLNLFFGMETPRSELIPFQNCCYYIGCPLPKGSCCIQWRSDKGITSLEIKPVDILGGSASVISCYSTLVCW